MVLGETGDLASAKGSISRVNLRHRGARCPVDTRCRIHPYQGSRSYEEPVKRIRNCRPAVIIRE